MKTREMRGLTALGMAMLMAAAVSCKKSDGDAAEPSQAQGVFRAAAEAQAGDKIEVFSNTYAHRSYIYTLTGDPGTPHGDFAEPAGGVEADFHGGDYVALYPAGENAEYDPAGRYAMTLPEVQQYAESSFGPGANPMAAASTSTSLAFKNLCGALMLTLSNPQGGKVQKIRVVSRKAGDRLRGRGTVSFGGDAPTLTMNETGTYNNVTLNCKLGTGDYKDGVDITTEKSFYIVLPDGTLQGGFDMEVTVMLHDKLYTYRKGVGGAVDNSIHRGLVRNMDELAISVGFVAQGNLVGFASGNLYCEPKEANGAENDAWGIEQHPWGYGIIQNGTSYNWDPTHVSHFYWTSDAAKAAGQAAFTKGSVFFTDSTNVENNYVFKAKDTDGVERQWRTLSNAEWGDIISTTRVTSCGHPWARVYMRPTPEQPGVKAAGDVPGLLLFPAEWGFPTKGESHGDFAELSAAAFQNSSGWASENFVREEWLEDNSLYGGCVFLPRAGYRVGSSGNDGTAVMGVGTGGFYWSSSPNGSGAWSTYFGSGNVITYGDDYRSNARSVRPVRVSEN